MRATASHRIVLAALVLASAALPLAAPALAAQPRGAQSHGGRPHGGQSAPDADRPDSLEGRIAPEDSSVAARLRTVVVRAESIVGRSAAAVQPTSILSRATIEAAHARDASDAVALVPGAFVRQYGGLGGLRTLSLRGSSAQQTVVLVDGIRYQSTASGGVDLGSIPSSALQRVEVVRGGDAARHGANALGGAVNLVTDRAVPGGGGVRARLDVGSFGERVATFAAAGSVGEHALNGSFTMTRFDGDYPFDYDEYGEQTEVRRENGDLASLFGRIAWSHPLDDDLRIAATAIGFDVERGVPGAIVQGHREQRRARLAEREIFSTLRATLTGAEWHGMLALSGRANRLEYRDPEATLNGPAGIDNRYDRREAALLVRASRPIGIDGMLEATGELSFARLDGDNLDPTVEGGVERLQWGASLGTNHSYDSLLPGSDLALDAAIRVDGFSDVEAAFSPSVGIVLRPGRGALRLRAHGSFNYRVPTFTEQYYLNYGNTDLRPESSMSVDVGATCEIFGTLLAEAGVFMIDTRDQIISVPRSPVVWSAMNVARTLSRGLELSLVGTAFGDLLALNFSYTRMRAEDRTPGQTEGRLLVYTPEELFAGLVELRGRSVAAGVVVQHASHRHSLPSNAPEGALPKYSLLAAHVRGNARLGPFDVETRLEVSNLLGERYAVVRNYPMPGRAVRIGVEVGYGVR